jgi:hypothetical protein
VRTHIKQLEAEISRLIAADPALARRFEVMTSIPVVGPIVVASLIAGLAEIGTANGRQIAALVGLAPVACDLGDSKGRRRIRGGREHVRSPSTSQPFPPCGATQTSRPSTEGSGTRRQSPPSRPSPPSPENSSHSPIPSFTTIASESKNTLD